MDGAWLAAGHFAAAGLMLVLAMVLLWLDPRDRAVRAFVAFLVLRTGVEVAIPLARVLATHDADSALALGLSSVYFHLATAGSVAWFVSEFPKRAPGFARLAIFAATVAALAIFAFARCWYTCGTSIGPLQSLLQALPLAVAAAATWFLLAAARMPTGPRRASTTILGIAFGVEAALWAGIAVPVAWTGSSDWPFLAGIVVATVAGVVLRGRMRAWVLTALAAAGLSAFIATRYVDLFAATLGFLLLGLWRLALPILAAYALLRHRLFDLDVRVKLAAQRATVGAIFAGVFFVVTEGSAYVLGSKFGMLAGIVAVGALVPAMGPLRRAAERVADLLPGEAGPARDLPIDRRRQIYHEFALQAWADGTLAREERAFLDSVRERLGLTADDALRLESEASRATQGG